MVALSLDGETGETGQGSPVVAMDLDKVSLRTVPQCTVLAVKLKGYLKDRNPRGAYKTAKEPIKESTGFTSETYLPPSVDECITYEEKGGWIGFRLPPEIMVVDNEDRDTMTEIGLLCQKDRPPTQKTNNGKQWTFSCNGDIRGADGVYTRSGLCVTYRLPMKNYCIMPTTNGRTWLHEGDLEKPPWIPDALLPYRKDNKGDLLNCIGWETHYLKRADHWGTYEQLQALTAFLLDIGIEAEAGRQMLKIVFGKDFDERKTEYFLTRNTERLERGEPVIGAGTLFESLKTDETKALAGFVRCLEKAVKPKGEKSAEDKETQAEKLIRIGSELPLFHDDMKEGHVELSGRNVKVRSAAFKQYLSKALWEQEKKAPNSDSLNQAQNVLEAMALFDGSCRPLFNRIGNHEGAIFYDLGDGRAVRTTMGQWEIVTDHPRIFKSYPHQQPQVEPKRGGNLEKLLDYLNITKEDHRLLAMVVLVAYYLPDIARPLLHPWGDQGSGKTTICVLFKRLIDPSKVAVFFAPRDLSETIQALEHHYFLCLDNLSDIPGWLSDLLSQAVTGGGLSKRKLYTDDDDCVYQLKRAISINGINQLIYRPDAMDRSLLIHHSRIDPARRRTETELYTEFEQDRPYLLGAIFDALAKAIEIRPTICLSTLPRMADFCLWGCAIAEALGYTRTDFLEAYQGNVEAQNSEVIGGNTLAQAVLAFMKNRMEWTGTVGEAFEELHKIASPKEKDGTFPKAANKLRGHLGRIKPNLLDFGVRFEIADFKVEKGVLITFQKCADLSSGRSGCSESNDCKGKQTEDNLNIPEDEKYVQPDVQVEKPRPATVLTILNILNIKNHLLGAMTTYLLTPMGLLSRTT